MNLLEWTATLFGWQQDALRRLSLNLDLSDEDRAAIMARVKHANGINAGDDVACVPLGADDVPPEGNDADWPILLGIGPVSHVDKLASDQELRCATDGLTLNFGDNGSGKSGYARIAKKLCYARKIDELCGDVFAIPPEPPPEVRFRYKYAADQEPTIVQWQQGAPLPQDLSRLMVLDAANAQVYVDGQNEITYLPREIEIVSRFGALLTAMGNLLQGELDQTETRCRIALGAGFCNETTAGQIVSLLTMGTWLHGLPSEQAVRDAAVWTDALSEELVGLEQTIADNPRIRAAMLERILAVFRGLSESLSTADASLNDNATQAIQALISEKIGTERAAEVAAARGFAGEPLGEHTGRGTWERMFAYARSFAAEAGIRNPGEPFQAGDTCPTCQQILGNEAAERLQRFDDFVNGAANAAAVAAAVAVSESGNSLHALRIATDREVELSLGEFSALGGVAPELTQSISSYVSQAAERKNALLAQFIDGQIAELPSLMASPVPSINAIAVTLASEVEQLNRRDGPDVNDLARLNELMDQRRLSEQLDAVLARLADLRLRIGLVACKAGCDTRQVSLFASARRRELVTPELRESIVAELQRLDLAHIPLRFDEAAARGRNYFEMVLASRQQMTKNRILSESEQRALGIACFLAEVARSPGRPGIIVDDPVTSLDLSRMRKVAERLVEEAATGRQVVIFTHNVVFYQEILSAAAARNPQVSVLPNFISKSGGRFGCISENDEPWVAKKITKRIEALRARLPELEVDDGRSTDDYRLKVKGFYTDLRETWERLVEETLLSGVVERFNAGVKTQNLKMVLVDDEDHRIVFTAMRRVSELSGHDMAAGRQLPMPNGADIRRDLDTLDQYRNAVQRRKRDLQARREALEGPPQAAVG
jgi:hypothetical protein